MSRITGSVVHNIATLKGMAEAGLIKLHEETGTLLRGFLPRKVTAWYIDGAVGSSSFEYRGISYHVQYVDGCFCPYVYRNHVIYQNKWCKLIESSTHYVLKSKSGKYNDQYFLSLNDARKAIGLAPEVPLRCEQ